jgi:hypothetical protein
MMIDDSDSKKLLTFNCTNLYRRTSVLPRCPLVLRQIAAYVHVAPCALLPCAAVVYTVYVYTVYGFAYCECEEELFVLHLLLGSRRITITIITSKFNNYKNNQQHYLLTQV